MLDRIKTNLVKVTWPFVCFKFDHSVCLLLSILDSIVAYVLIIISIYQKTLVMDVG